MGARRARDQRARHRPSGSQHLARCGALRCSRMQLSRMQLAHARPGTDSVQSARWTQDETRSQRAAAMRRRPGSDGVRLARALTRSKKSCRCMGQSSGISLAVSIVRRISKRSGSAVGGETSSDSSDMIPAGLWAAKRTTRACGDQGLGEERARAAGSEPHTEAVSAARSPVPRRESEKPRCARATWKLYIFAASNRPERMHFQTSLASIYVVGNALSSTTVETSERARTRAPRGGGQGWKTLSR